MTQPTKQPGTDPVGEPISTPISTAGPALARAVTSAAAHHPESSVTFTVYVRASGDVTVWLPGESIGVDLSPDIASNVRGLLLVINEGTIR